MPQLFAGFVAAFVGIICLDAICRYREWAARDELARYSRLKGLYLEDLKRRWLAGEIKGRPSWKITHQGVAIQILHPFPGYRVAVGIQIDGQRKLLPNPF